MCKTLTNVLILVLIGLSADFTTGQESATPIQTKRSPAPLATGMPAKPVASADKRARWMQDRLESLGSRPLNRLVLPASHDAAMYEDGFLKSLAQTQDLTIYQQLSHGIRYFDLRPQWYDGKLVIHHGPVQGPDLAVVLRDVRRFAGEGHHELIILKFSHYQGFQDQAYKGLKKQIKESLGPWLYKSLPRGKRLAEITLAEYVGHSSAVLVLCDGSYAMEQRSEGIWVYRDWDSRHPEQGDLCVYDQYSNTVQYPAMKADQFDKFNRFDGKCKARRDVPCDLFLLSWTLTPATNVRGFAAEPNRNLESALKELKIPNRFGCVVNLLYADYVDSAKVTEVAIRQNEMLSAVSNTHAARP